MFIHRSKPYIWKTWLEPALISTLSQLESISFLLVFCLCVFVCAELELTVTLETGCSNAPVQRVCNIMDADLSCLILSCYKAIKTVRMAEYWSSFMLFHVSKTKMIAADLQRSDEKLSNYCFSCQDNGKGRTFGHIFWQMSNVDDNPHSPKDFIFKVGK